MNREELKNIAPKLNELKKLKSGFKVPEEYFEDIEHTVFSKIITTTLEKDSPFKVPKDYFDTIEENVLNKVNSKKEQTDFSIPKNYFDTIEDRVFEKINNEPKVINLKNKFIKTFLPIAAAASLLLFITLQVFNDTNNSNELLANLEVSEIENWIENGDLELNSYEIASVYEDVNFEELEVNQLYNDENLIEYLDNIDIELLNLTN